MLIAFKLFLFGIRILTSLREHKKAEKQHREKDPSVRRLRGNRLAQITPGQLHRQIPANSDTEQQRWHEA